MLCQSCSQDSPLEARFRVSRAAPLEAGTPPLRTPTTQPSSVPPAPFAIRSFLGEASRRRAGGEAGSAEAPFSQVPRSLQMLRDLGNVKDA